MHTISFINWKGGVGKTSISVNTAYAFSALMPEDKILFIDADKQGNASAWFEADAEQGSLTDILLEEKGAREVIQHTRYPNIDIIASDDSLIQANYAILSDTDRVQTGILKKALQEVQDDYTICVIDYPPDSNVPVLNCLEVTDDIVVMALPNKFSLLGIQQLERELQNYKADLGLDLRISGVLINQRTGYSREFVEEIQAKYPTFPPIRGGRNTQHWLDKGINQNKSVYELSPTSGFVQDMRKFIDKLQLVIMSHYDNSVKVEWQV